MPGAPWGLKPALPPAPPAPIPTLVRIFPAPLLTRGAGVNPSFTFGWQSVPKARGAPTGPSLAPASDHPPGVQAGQGGPCQGSPGRADPPRGGPPLTSGDRQLAPSGPPPRGRLRDSQISRSRSLPPATLFEGCRKRTLAAPRIPQGTARSGTKLRPPRTSIARAARPRSLTPLGTGYRTDSLQTARPTKLRTAPSLSALARPRLSRTPRAAAGRP